MQIQDLKIRKSKKAKRIGRGGKKGTYSGKGMKGQKSRSGYSQRATFEGGKSTLVEHSKKLRGFKSKRPSSKVVGLETIEKYFTDGELVNPESLKKKKLINNKKGVVKILSNGQLKKKVVFEGVLFSKSALLEIEKNGSKVLKEKSFDNPGK